MSERFQAESDYFIGLLKEAIDSGVDQRLIEVLQDVGEWYLKMKVPRFPNLRDDMIQEAVWKMWLILQRQQYAAEHLFRLFLKVAFQSAIDVIRKDMKLPLGGLQTLEGTDWELHERLPGWGRRPWEELGMSPMEYSQGIDDILRRTCESQAGAHSTLCFLLTNILGYKPSEVIDKLEVPNLSELYEYLIDTYCCEGSYPQARFRESTISLRNSLGQPLNVVLTHGQTRSANSGILSVPRISQVRAGQTTLQLYHLSRAANGLPSAMTPIFALCKTLTEAVLETAKRASGSIDIALHYGDMPIRTLLESLTVALVEEFILEDTKFVFSGNSVDRQKDIEERRLIIDLRAELSAAEVSAWAQTVKAFLIRNHN
jgi:hypothetical protein